MSVKFLGPVPSRARAVLILVHGGGDCATDILPLYGALEVPDVSALAPQAPEGAWYPDVERSLEALEALVAVLDVPRERLALLGFAEGASLVLEFAARHPGRYGAVMSLAGGLLTLHHEGSLAGTPVFLGGGDADPHAPFSRVLETRQALERMGARVDLRRYPGAPQRVNDDEVRACRELLLAI